MTKPVVRNLLLALVLITPALAADPIRPDPTLTPGVWNDPPTPLHTLCAAGHTEATRNVSSATKAQTFRAYGYDPRSIVRQNYEIDHLIPLELDGANAPRNLWPQSYRTTLNARHKDVLENAMHRAVCAGRMPLRDAQVAIARDWIAAYQAIVLHKGVK